MDTNGVPRPLSERQEMWEGALDGPSEMVTSPYTWYLRAALVVDLGLSAAMSKGPVMVTRPLL